MTELMDPIEHVVFERVARIVESARAPGESSFWTATIHFDPLVDRGYWSSWTARRASDTVAGGPAPG